MNVIEGKSIAELLDWLEGEEGATLAREERDVRIFTHAGLSLMGSVSAVSGGRITVMSYSSSELRAAIDVSDIVRVEVFNSRRLRPLRAYRQMLELEKALSGHEDTA